MNDAEYITAIKIGHKATEAHFYRAHFSYIEFMVLKNSGSPEDAKDIYQEPVLVLYDKIVKGELDYLTCSLKSYLYSIALNKWRYHLRNIRRVSFIDLPDEIQQAQESHDQEMVEHRFDLAEEALEMIDELCLKIIRAFYLQKMKLNVMAKKFGYKDENSMKKRKSLCMKTARRNLMVLQNKKKATTHEKLFWINR